MCGRFTVKATSAKLVATMDARGRKYKGLLGSQPSRALCARCLARWSYKFASYSKMVSEALIP